MNSSHTGNTEGPDVVQNASGISIDMLVKLTDIHEHKLSAMADHKAEILITVNSIIISAIIGLILKELGVHRFLAFPSYLLLTVNILTMILAIRVVMPSLPAIPKKPGATDEKQRNLLFFGNFRHMRLKEYTHRVRETLGDRERLYDTLLEDIYFQGLVLSRKYRLLRTAYNVFMYGLVLSVIAFFLSSFFNEGSAL
jgi:hypothetical protein